jgi:SAM-dependent methyltransferase
MVCTHIQVSPIPDEKDLVALYKNVSDDSFYGNGCSVGLIAKYQSDKTFLARFFSERLDVIDSLGLNKSSKILDFGCTNGVFVMALEDAGFLNGYGYDIAEELVDEGQRRGLRLFTGRIDELAAAEHDSFDLVISYNVFEHLAEPKTVLASLQHLLRKDAHLVISVPFIKSLQARLLKEKSPIVDPPFHIHYFTRKSAARLLSEHGFEVLRMSTPFWSRLTDVYLTMHGFSETSARLLRYLATPLRGVMMLLNLGGNLLIVAKRV